MNTTQTLVNQTTGCLAAPRPYAGASWIAGIRKSMTVPTFHDRWPLCST